MEDQLHPTVREFKNFLAKHPQLVKEIRKSGRSWQEHYEKWALLGEDDPFWSQYKEGNTETEKEGTKEEGESNRQSQLFGKLMQLTENIDLDKVQKQVNQLNSTISTIQEVLGQFQDTKKVLPKPTNPSNRNNGNGFNNWFRD